MARLVSSARHRYDQQFFKEVAARQPNPVKAKLTSLIHTDVVSIDADGIAGEDDPEQFRIHALKTGSGAAKISNIKQVVTRLVYLQEIALPDDLFAGVPWRYLHSLPNKLRWNHSATCSDTKTKTRHLPCWPLSVGYDSG
jgi:hypothetical protein